MTDLSPHVSHLNYVTNIRYGGVAVTATVVPALEDESQLELLQKISESVEKGKSVFEVKVGLTLETDLVLITAAPPNKTTKQQSKENLCLLGKGTFPRASMKFTEQALHYTMTIP